MQSAKRAIKEQEMKMSLEKLIAFKMDQAISELIETILCEGFCHWSLRIPSSSV